MSTFWIITLAIVAVLALGYIAGMVWAIRVTRGFDFGDRVTAVLLWPLVAFASIFGVTK